MASRPLIHADVRSTIATRCPAGHPQVLRCYPLRTADGRCEPFPTLYWLACPQLVAAVSRLEHEGWIRRLGERLETDADLRAALARDHDAYIAERYALLCETDRFEIERRGLRGEFFERGIGGMRNRAAIKCLHLHYAHHLARGSALGTLLEALGELHACQP